MNSLKVGQLILALRKEKKMTQKEVADQLLISDRTVSKWERGIGCPDISLLPSLANLFGVSAEDILSGELSCNVLNGGNMKRIKFYVCPICGNIIYSMNTLDIACCGRKLEPLEINKPDDLHHLNMTESDGEDYITFEHPMNKDHYLSFVALVTYDRVMLVKLYPEQSGALRIPRKKGSKLYYYCTQDGLFMI